MARLLFIGGGPWDEKERDSCVRSAPARIGRPTSCTGIYERLGIGQDEFFLDVWRGDERLDADCRLDRRAEHTIPEEER